MEPVNQEINELISHTNALHCTDHPTPTLTAASDTPPLPPSLTLIGKIISHRPFSKISIKQNILQAWQLKKAITTEDREENKMVFTFEDTEDLSKVLNNSPWNIKGTPLFLKRWENDETFEDITFQKAAFWVQVHGLTLEQMTTENAISIAENLGGLVEIDNLDNSKPTRKSFLRIRALIPIEDPLPTGFILHRPPKAPALISYQYERLSDFCYDCGRLGHQSFHCPEMPNSTIKGKYGPKLKARPAFLNRVETLLPTHRHQQSGTTTSPAPKLHATPPVDSSPMASLSYSPQLSFSKASISFREKEPSPNPSNLTVANTELDATGISRPSNSAALMVKPSLVNLQLNTTISEGPTTTNPASSFLTNPVETSSHTNAMLLPTTISQPNATLTSSHTNQTTAMLTPSPETSPLPSKPSYPHSPLKPPKYQTKTSPRFHPYPKQTKTYHAPVLSPTTPQPEIPPAGHNSYGVQTHEIFEEVGISMPPSVP
jgi:hypothetical protein